MRPLLFLTIIGFGLFNNLNAQCAAQIQGPSQAISNCNGPQVSVLATGPGPYQYSWFSSTLSIQSSGSASPMLSTATPGWHSYGVYVVDSNNCTSLAVDSIELRMCEGCSWKFQRPVKSETPPHDFGAAGAACLLEAPLCPPLSSCM